MSYDYAGKYHLVQNFNSQVDPCENTASPGSWEKLSGHNAALFDNRSSETISTDKAIQHYLSKGVEPSKLVMGEF